MSILSTLSNISSPSSTKILIEDQNSTETIQQELIENTNAIAIPTINNKTDLQSNSCEPSSFQPSFLARTLSQFTAPRTLVTCGALGVAILCGASIPIALGAAGIALAAQQVATKIVSGGDVLRSAVFMEAEPLSIVSVKGGLPIITIPPMLEALRLVDSPDARIAVNCLENLLNYETNFNLLGISNAPLVNELIHHVINLEPGQKTALPFSYMHPKEGGHIIIGSVEKKDGGKFIVRFHNGGQGLNNHYNKVESATGNRLYQTTLEIDDVEEFNLIPFIHQMTSLNVFRSNHKFSDVYGSILLLKGNVLPPSSDSRLWTRAQEGMSCSGYSLRCFLLSILTPESFREFEFKFLTLATAKLKDEIENGSFWNQTSEHKIAYHELRGKLIRIGGTDPGQLENVSTSQLANVASKAQALFWSRFFSPPFFTHGMCGDEFERIGLIFYEELHSSYIRAIESYTVVNDVFKIKTDEETKADKNKFNRLFKKFVENIDSSLFSGNDLAEIDDYINRNAFNIPLQNIYKTSFSNLEFISTEENVLKLLRGVEHLKKKEYPAARKELENVYRQVESLESISSETAKEYAYAMCKMLYFLNYPAEQLEDIELRAAAAVIFAKLAEKASDKGKEFLKLSGIFERSLENYRKHRLEKEFPNSPWSEDIYKMHDKS